jgi:hypothetical protein
MKKQTTDEIKNIISLIYAGIVSENEDILTSDILEQVLSMPDTIIQKSGIENVNDSMKKELLKLVSEIIATNLILFDEPNFEWTEEFVADFFQSKEFELSDNSDNLKMLILSALSLTTKEYLNFHLELFFSDRINLKQMEKLNKVVLNKSSVSLLESMYYISKNQDTDYLKENVFMSGRVYAYALAALYNALLKNENRIVDYIHKPESFLKKVEEYFLENYSSLIIKTNLIHEKITG